MTRRTTTVLHATTAGSARADDRYSTFATPLGAFFLAYTDAGVTMALRGSDSESLEAYYLYRYGRTPRYTAAPPTWLPEALQREFSGKVVTWRFDLNRLSPFERSVLVKTCEIPRGEVRSYSWVAQQIGKPKALRAVGTALANNPIPILIPCHRVVRLRGLGNYSGGDGIASKRELLVFEGCNVDALEEQLRLPKARAQ